MHFDWKSIARIGAGIAAAETGIPAIQAAETAAESAVSTTQAHKSVDAQVDAYSALAVQVIESAEGFQGKELVDDAQIQLLIKGVHDSLHALAAGLLAKKVAP